MDCIVQAFDRLVLDLKKIVFSRCLSFLGIVMVRLKGQDPFCCRRFGP